MNCFSQRKASEVPRLSQVAKEQTNALKGQLLTLQLLIICAVLYKPQRDSPCTLAYSGLSLLWSIPSLDLSFRYGIALAASSVAVGTATWSLSLQDFSFPYCLDLAAISAVLGM